MLTMLSWPPTNTVAKAGSYQDFDSGATTGSVMQATVTSTFGAEDPTRLIVCVVHMSKAFGAVTLTSATIAGVPATIHVQSSPAIHSYAFYSIYDTTAIISAEVPTGASGSVVLNFSGTDVGYGVACFQLVGLTSITPHDTASAAANSTTIDVPAAGVLIAGATGQQGLTETWSGVTESYDQATVQTLTSASGGISTGLSLEASRSVSITPSSGTAAQALVAVSWG